MKYLLLTLLLIIGVFAYRIEVFSMHRAVLQTKPEYGLTAANEDDIREAVFRYQFAHNASAQQQGAKVYFLSLAEDKDPSDRFMLRFKDHTSDGRSPILP